MKIAQESPAAVARAKRRKRVVALYENHVKEYIQEQKLSPDRLFTSIALELGMTKDGVKYILRKEGLFSTNKALTQHYS